MIRENDTIAALATPPGIGAISIIRVSGPRSLEIADRLFRCRGPKPSERPHGTFLVGRVEGPEGFLDEAILLIFRAPKSYTREDVVEIQCHGGRESSRRILRAVLEHGARLAEPGEFTQRAFLNGRIDLTQAEAVMDLIAAQSERAASAAAEQMRGELRKRLEECYNQVISASADLEAGLDFLDEGEVPDGLEQSAYQTIEKVLYELKYLLSTWEEGHRLREGALVVITGRPNVGKSTLMNALLGKPRAIVTPIPGTTRDTIEETWILDGIPVRLVDTAGLRDTDCEIEKEGIARAKALMEQADLRLHLIEGMHEFTNEDRKSLQDTDTKRCIIIRAKMDLGLSPTPKIPNEYTTICISAKNGLGLDHLRLVLGEKLLSGKNRPPHAVISERHRSLLMEAEKELQCARKTLENLKDPTIPIAHLRSAAEAIGRVTGRTYHEDLLNQVFSRFCVGK